MSNIENLEYIKKHISNNEKTKLINKKQKGEIFTPYECITKMLDTIENIYFNKYKKNIYSNKNLKWYDNSSGIGNFMMVIYYKLNDGLKNIIKDNEKRKKHILENMIYMTELETMNVNKCIEYFDIEKKYKININCDDSLCCDIKKLWNIDGFDIIIGNPPYQKQNKKNNKSRGGTNNNLYIDFVKKSINDIKENGYLVYIHPQNWRKIGNNILDNILNWKIEYLGLNYGGKLFKNVSVNTDFYVLRKTNNENNFESIIECYDKKNKMVMNDKFKIEKINFIPKYYTSTIQSIMNKIIKNGKNRNCIINSYCHKIRNHVVHKDKKTDEHIYPLYNTSGNPYDYYSSKKHYDQDKKKVILSCSGKLKPLYDDGKYGTTQDSMYFIVDSENDGKNLIKILNSQLYVFIIHICQWGNFRNEQKLFSYIKYPIIENINDNINDDYINTYFNLSDDEIKILKSI
jgi:hypothetical protein